MSIEISVFQGEKIVGRYHFSKQNITIGRGQDNDIILPEKFVSRVHAVLENRGDKWIITDHSANGTFVDNEQLNGEISITAKTRIEIYPFFIQCRIYGEEETVSLHRNQTQTNDEKIDVVPQDNVNFPIQIGTNRYNFGLIVGEHPLMLDVYHLINRISRGVPSILIRGEHGTGKELVAQAIHQNSMQKDGPYIPLNCAAIPETLIESELFGHEKGTFTGASTQKKGKIEEANKGTLFLDEIGELSLPGQAKLLRFLQEKRFSRLGSTKEIEVDVRIISATNRNLEQAIQQNTFRADLYYRLRVVQIQLPSLKDRSTDIPLLAQHILGKLTKEYCLEKPPSITLNAMGRLTEYSWPGNIRQLENVIFSSFLKARNPELIDTEDLDLDQEYNQSTSALSTLPTLDEISRQTLIQTLEKCNWDTQSAAKLLKVSRGTIYYKLKKYNIDPRQHKS